MPTKIGRLLETAFFFTSTRKAGRFRFRRSAGALLAVQLAACAGTPPDDPPPPFGAEAVAGWRTVDLSHAYGGDTPGETGDLHFPSAHLSGPPPSRIQAILRDHPTNAKKL